jgi:hypothetical protein
MGRLLGGFGVLFAMALVPLALAPNVVWLAIPGHFIFSLVVAVGAVQQGFDGQATGVKAWGILYVVTSVGIAVAMEFGGATRASWYWMVPWTFMLLWGWFPAVVISLAAWGSPARQRRLNRQAVRNRKRAVIAGREKAKAAASRGPAQEDQGDSSTFEAD